MQSEVTFKIDTDQLRHYTDEHISSLWHVAQANPAPFGDRDAGALAEMIGREIIRRWLRWAGAPLWNHQGRDHYSLRCRQIAAEAATQATALADDATTEVK
jgi:hypothetical protein